MNDPIQHKEGPALVFAGAGAGKTRTLTQRVKWLVEQGEDPYAITLITFTNKAAKEMKSRIAGLLEEPLAEGVWVGTFHRFCLQALQVYGHEIGLDKVAVLDANDQHKLAERIIAGLFPEKPPKNFTPTAALGAVSRAANSGWDDLELATMYADLEKIANFRWAYQDAKRELGVLDYDDLLLQGVRLLKLSEGAARMARRRAAYLMVDEFQDTNGVQLELVRALAPGASPNLMVVGDPDQSIYGWRGANYRTILQFRQYYPTAVVYGLYTNYRSQAAVVEVANRVIAKNAERKPEVQQAHLPKGEEPFLMAAKNRWDEAHFVARAVEFYRAQGIPLEEMAVLMRANFLSREVEQALRVRGIPYQFTGGKGFFERREVQLGMAALKVLSNPKDSLALAALVEEMVEGAGPVGIQKVLEAGKALNLSPLEAFRNPVALKGLRGKEVQAKAARLAEALQEQVSRLAGEAPEFHVLLKETMDRLGFEGWLDHLGEDAEQRCVRQANLERLIQAVQEWQKDNPQGLLQDLVITLLLEADTSPEESQGVHLMTVHASKGMEFRVVFVIGLNEGLFPLRKAGNTLEGLEEERRLMYVAVTRAKEFLHLSYAADGTVSRFAQEAGVAVEKYDPQLGWSGRQNQRALKALLEIA
jgi:DNA helicase-2/ATP-dependent DNA helicase PcrA